MLLLVQVKNNLKYSNKKTCVLALSGLVVFLTSCQTTEKVVEMEKSSYWVFKTKVHTTKKNKKITGYSHITYANKDKVRIDVFGPLGLIHAATLVYNDQKFEALLPLEKRYISGDVTERTMLAVIKIPIDPGMFHNLIYQKGFENKDWQCVLGATNKVKECSNMRAGLKVSWNEDMSKSGGEFFVQHEEGTALFTFKKYKDLDQVSADKFILSPPMGYTRFKADENGIRKL